MSHRTIPTPVGNTERREEHPGKGRTIPTPVGNTGGGAGTIAEWPDHPHARGEHMVPCAPDGRSDGPSPRPWGTRRCGSREARPAWTIPTPVGNTGP